MKNIFVFFAIVIAVILVFPALANAEFISVKGLISNGYIDGKIQSDRAEQTGTNIGVRNILGVTDAVIVPEIEGKLTLWGTQRFIFSYSPASYEGKRQLRQDTFFAGTKFGTSETVKTTMDVGIASFSYESLVEAESMSEVMSPEESDYGFLIGMKFFHVDTQISSSDSGKSVSQAKGMPFPFLGLRLQGQLMEKVQMEFSYTFSSLSVNHNRIYWSDFITELKTELDLKYLPTFNFGAGYRIMKSTIDSTDGNGFLSRLGFDGLFVSAVLKY